MRIDARVPRIPPRRPTGAVAAEPAGRVVGVASGAASGFLLAKLLRLFEVRSAPLWLIGLAALGWVVGGAGGRAIARGDWPPATPRTLAAGAAGGLTGFAGGFWLVAIATNALPLGAAAPAVIYGGAALVAVLGALGGAELARGG